MIFTSGNKLEVVQPLAKKYGLLIDTFETRDGPLTDELSNVSPFTQRQVGFKSIDEDSCSSYPEEFREKKSVVRSDEKSCILGQKLEDTLNDFEREIKEIEERFTQTQSKELN